MAIVYVYHYTLMSTHPSLFRIFSRVVSKNKINMNIYHNILYLGKVYKYEVNLPAIQYIAILYNNQYL